MKRTDNNEFVTIEVGNDEIVDLVSQAITQKYSFKQVTGVVISAALDTRDNKLSMKAIIPLPPAEIKER